ncbi:pyrimidodiazepine synthase [Anabrus simplex]|uniref:pyrimidodiazepine synthase n=1 Tax=Anabrus simplex TaxID=316456 RepID=UPI0034DD6BC2
MSTKHLSVGSTCPPKEEGKLRLYSMHFCPFAQRVKLVLNVKGIPYDVVNVNLKKKPEWISKLHPQGKVPALDTGDEVLVESLDIADYLDAKYPEPPLYPSDPERKAKDKELIEKFGKVVSATSNALFDKDKQPLEYYMAQAYDTLQEFETELACRGTTFFGGEKPGMVDLMIWPWTEHSKMPVLLRNETSKFPKEKFPKLIALKRAMQELDPVKDTIIDTKTRFKFYSGYVAGNASFDDL